MKPDTLLTPPTFAVLQRVPREWMDMAVVIDGIVEAAKTQVGIPMTRGSVAQRLTQLRKLGLVERRGACQLGARSVFELRRAVDE